MKTVRFIPKLEVKGANLIKGVHLEGLRVVGTPHDAAMRYYEEGADELIYMDLVASLYQRNSLHEIVEQTAEQVFIPLTVGGGVRTIEDIRSLLRAGADKVSINTAAINHPEFIEQAADEFGSQCIVVSIEAKRSRDGGWECYTDCGRVQTGVDAINWAFRVARLGAGEILLTSIDQDGIFRGYDLELVRKVADSVNVPVIACGGASGPNDVAEVVLQGGADAACAAAILHFEKYSIPDVKACMMATGMPVRMVEPALAV